MITDDVRHEVAAKMLEIFRENPDVSLQGMVASAMNECLPDGMEYGAPNYCHSCGVAIRNGH